MDLCRTPIEIPKRTYVGGADVDHPRWRAPTFRDEEWIGGTS
jgi:hypothetical protein